MQRRPAFAIALLMLAGCHTAAIKKPPASPRPVEPVRVQICEWHAQSPGAGFTRTSQWACDVDLRRHLKRTIDQTARRPEPMIADPGESVPPELLAEGWRPMDDDEVKRLRAAIDAWLATSPPEVCEFYTAGRGREDGFMMRFRLQTDDATYIVHANPNRPRREIEPCHPDRTFWNMVSALSPNLRPT